VPVEQLRPHLWRWTARHPEWKPGDDWGQEVSSVAIVHEEFVLVDPLAPQAPEEARSFWEAVDADVDGHGPPHVVLTVPWHYRSAQAVLDRYDGARLWLHERSLTDAEVAPTDTFRLEDQLPGGLQPLDGRWADEALLWSAAHRALITGDVLLGDADGGLRLCPESWIPAGMTRPQLAGHLRPLLELPVELVLPGHGEPVRDDAHTALTRALDV
jgi:glyoxylase-like metal-dependent hydrolase (beta-lactamase superfamily II)